MKYKYFFEQRITRYYGQWYCYLCKIVLQNLTEAQCHSEDAHSFINTQISDFPDKKSIKLTNTKCKKLLQHSIVIRDVQRDYFCIYCQSSIFYFHDCFQHVKEENHQKCINAILKQSTNEQQNIQIISNTNNKQSKASVNVENPTQYVSKSNLSTKTQSICENKLMKDSSNDSMQMVNKTIANVPYALMQEDKMYKHFLMQHTVHYGQWYCHVCKFILQSLTDVTRHLQEAHSDSITQIPDFIEKSIEWSDTNCRELLHKKVMQNIPQDYCCVPCQCFLPSIDHFYEHSTGKKHKHRTQCNKKYINDNIVLKDSVDRQQNLNNDTYDNQNVSVNVLDGNDLIKNLPSNFKSEEKSAVSFKSCNKDGISDVLQTERYITFCCLCDEFICKTTIKSHMTDKIHKSAASVLKTIKISNQQMMSCIIKLEKERKTVKALQLNSKKFDGTVWPEYTETTAKYTCDQCNKVIEENNIINHEIIVHKNGTMSSMTFIDNWSIKDLNVAIYSLFKCSFCNEIIHGILSLRAHFSKSEHEENIIKLLIDIKRREYSSSKNIQTYLEPLEFLSLISFENNGGTVRIQEEPVMYIKNHCTTFCKNAVDMQKKFIYVCFVCQCKFYEPHNVINHLCNTLRHLKHFKSIFLTYNYIHNVSTSRKLNISESKHEVKSEAITINTESLKKHNTNKTQINTEQYRNHNSIAKVNTSSKNNNLSQSEEKNSGFFISPDIHTEINTLIKGINFISNQSCTKFEKSTLDRHNKMYEKEFLDFEEIMFACNQRKLKEIKSNLRFFLPYFNKIWKLNCLICSDSLLRNAQTIYEHINSEKHIIQFKKLRENKEHFELLTELMKIQSAHARCSACNRNVYRTCKNGSSMNYKDHLRCPTHKKNRKQLLSQAECILEELEFKNLWYNIQYFACVDCNRRFKRKINFMEHLNVVHKTVLNNKDNSMFDFCLTCTTLWYKNEKCANDIRINYQIHCQQQTHQYLEKSNDFAVTSLPPPLQKLLKDVDGIAANLFKLSKNVSNDPKVTQFMAALKHIFKTRRLPVEVCMFGSRVTGLALTNSDIDIYLDFGDECIDPKLIKHRSMQIQNCLRTDHENWDIELTLDRSRTPLIKVKHRLTGLQCDISFMNGLSVENSKFIRSFNTAYPSCQKLTLFLKKWLSVGGLTGPDGITNYALVWLVIFYLQVEFEIPSIADLIKKHNHSKIVSGWETGVSDIILIKVQKLSIHELLLKFFEYYGGFDYRHFVICPLLGKKCGKKAFAEVSTLPDPMKLYIAQLRNKKPEYFRIDSPMCVQDPFDLSHNLTKAVPILTLKRFKHYCNASLSVLRSVIIQVR